MSAGHPDDDREGLRDFAAASEENREALLNIGERAGPPLQDYIERVVREVDA